MRIDTIIDELTAVIREDSYFDDMKVIYSYPSAPKPSRINNVYIALGIGEINLRSDYIDDSKRMGEVQINIDIFAPLKMSGRDVAKIFTRLCSRFDRYNVLSISASNIHIDNYIQANTLKTSVKLGDEIDFGGIDYE